MKEKVVTAVKLTPDFFVDLIILILMLPRKIITEFDKITIDNGHYYLQQYCVLEIIIMSVFTSIFIQHSNFIIADWKELKELSDLQFGVVCGTPVLLWPLINKIWDSIAITWPAIDRKKENDET